MSIMRVSLLVLLLLVCGCISEQGEQPNADSGKIDSVFNSLINESAGGQGTQDTNPTFTNPPTTQPAVASSSSTATTHTTVTLKATTTTVFRDMECSKVPHPMGPIDCNRGYCTDSRQYCRYLPGTLNSGTGRCICALVKH